MPFLATRNPASGVYRERSPRFKSAAILFHRETNLRNNRQFSLVVNRNLGGYNAPLCFRAFASRGSLAFLAMTRARERGMETFARPLSRRFDNIEANEAWRILTDGLI